MMVPSPSLARFRRAAERADGVSQRRRRGRHGRWWRGRLRRRGAWRGRVLGGKAAEEQAAQAAYGARPSGAGARRRIRAGDLIREAPADVERVDGTPRGAANVGILEAEPNEVGEVRQLRRERTAHPRVLTEGEGLETGELAQLRGHRPREQRHGPDDELLHGSEHAELGWHCPGDRICVEVQLLEVAELAYLGRDRARELIRNEVQSLQGRAELADLAWDGASEGVVVKEEGGETVQLAQLRGDGAGEGVVVRPEANETFELANLGGDGAAEVVEGREDVVEASEQADLRRQASIHIVAVVFSFEDDLCEGGEHADLRGKRASGLHAARPEADAGVVRRAREPLEAGRQRSPRRSCRDVVAARAAGRAPERRLLFALHLDGEVLARRRRLLEDEGEVPCRVVGTGHVLADGTCVGAV
mmetsp:Transcript_14777/g.43406  ORF Transcript_14777/g.43406 Transcript_14777/m.43406 type:complete len:418 (+) Transcript_14777:213-1466(+)